MQYDPIKFSLGKIVNKSIFFRKVFYFLLDILLLRSWHIRKEIKRAAPHLPENSFILDAGSGFGQYSYFLARKFKKAKINGIDIKSEQVEDCNSFFTLAGLSDRVFFKTLDLTTFEEKEIYNLILSIDVMEHIEKDTEVFGRLYNALTENGILLVSTPSDLGGSDAHDEDDPSFIDEHVRNGYNIGEIESKLRNAGFSKIVSHYSYGKPGKLSWILSMKYPIIMLNKSKLFFILLPLYYLIIFPFFIILNFLDININHREGTGLIVKAYK